MLNQVTIMPSYSGHTMIFGTSIDDSGVVRIKRMARQKHMGLEQIVEFMRGYNSRTPIFVDPAYPQIRDALHLRGYWVLK